MTVKECIQTIRNNSPNEFKEEDIAKWLYELDLTVQNEIINTHKGEKSDISFDDYKNKTATLLVSEPYSEMYIYWIQAKADYFTGETDRYNNSYSMFNMAYHNFANFYNRTHKPLQTELNFFS